MAAFSAGTCRTKSNAKGRRDAGATKPSPHYFQIEESSGNFFCTGNILSGERHETAELWPFSRWLPGYEWSTRVRLYEENGKAEREVAENEKLDSRAVEGDGAGGFERRIPAGIGLGAGFDWNQDPERGGGGVR